MRNGASGGILDTCPNGFKAGCEDLFNAIMEKKPKYHIFGHIHGGHGIKKFMGTTFINASSCDEGYNPRNLPVVIEL